MKPKIGDTCPTFELKNQDGKLINIKNFIGHQHLVIYFYPKDNTGGCTAQACEFRNQMDEFSKLNATIFGISSDSVKSHKDFATKNNLTFDILSDENGIIRNKFSVKKSIFGLIQGRETFVVDKDGIIRGIYNSLSNVKAHVEFAKKILSKLKD
ncbi:MAG: peroxiredoxin [Bacteroidota bacterium]